MHCNDALSRPCHQILVNICMKFSYPYIPTCASLPWSCASHHIVTFLQPTDWVIVIPYCNLTLCTSYQYSLCETPRSSLFMKQIYNWLISTLDILTKPIAKNPSKPNIKIISIASKQKMLFSFLSTQFLYFVQYIDQFIIQYFVQYLSNSSQFSHLLLTLFPTPTNIPFNPNILVVIRPFVEHYYY